MPHICPTCTGFVCTMVSALWEWRAAAFACLRQWVTPRTWYLALKGPRK